ncbi:hypothetical protein BLNAU_23733 [Blattamonas nauphoetae]|uniref:Uncharacterized protein n=1 Tax=Blattamonas nauphoetae TaxID=2049346 RepID=A0ABQ9WPF5_9EUKA|nr:hypothetical protein BLNAU_23733 [Blattamonas nauphoetae]
MPFQKLSSNPEENKKRNRNKQRDGWVLLAHPHLEELDVGLLVDASLLELIERRRKTEVKRRRASVRRGGGRSAPCPSRRAAGAWGVEAGDDG